MTIQKKEITLGEKIRVQSCTDTNYNFLRITYMARNNTDMKLEAVILSGIVFFSQFFCFNDKGGKIEDEKGSRRKHSCVRREVLIILP